MLKDLMLVIIGSLFHYGLSAFTISYMVIVFYLFKFLLFYWSDVYCIMHLFPNWGYLEKLFLLFTWCSQIAWRLLCADFCDLSTSPWFICQCKCHVLVLFLTYFSCMASVYKNINVVFIALCTYQSKWTQGDHVNLLSSELVISSFLKGSSDVSILISDFQHPQIFYSLILLTNINPS